MFLLGAWAHGLGINSRVVAVQREMPIVCQPWGSQDLGLGISVMVPGATGLGHASDNACISRARRRPGHAQLTASLGDANIHKNINNTRQPELIGSPPWPSDGESVMGGPSPTRSCQFRWVSTYCCPSPHPRRISSACVLVRSNQPLFPSQHLFILASARPLGSCTFLTTRACRTIALLISGDPTQLFDIDMHFPPACAFYCGQSGFSRPSSQSDLSPPLWPSDETQLRW